MKRETLENYTTELETNCGCISYCECWEDDKENSHYLIMEWLERNNKPEGALITGRNLTWQRLSGYAIVRNSDTAELARAILAALMINGEFIIRLTLEGKQLTARRSSHDEPTGASLEILPVDVCQGWSECLDIENLQELDGAKFCAWCLDLEIANR